MARARKQIVPPQYIATESDMRCKADVWTLVRIFIAMRMTIAMHAILAITSVWFRGVIISYRRTVAGHMCSISELEQLWNV